MERLKFYLLRLGESVAKFARTAVGLAMRVCAMCTQVFVCAECTRVIACGVRVNARECDA